MMDSAFSLLGWALVCVLAVICGLIGGLLTDSAAIWACSFFGGMAAGWFMFVRRPKQ